MSGFTVTWSGALGSAALAGMLAAGSLAGCGGTRPDDLFASHTTGKGGCIAGECRPIVDPSVAAGAGGGSIDSTPIPDAATTGGGDGTSGNGGASGQEPARPPSQPATAARPARAAQVAGAHQAPLATREVVGSARAVWMTRVFATLLQSAVLPAATALVEMVLARSDHAVGCGSRETKWRWGRTIRRSTECEPLYVVEDTAWSSAEPSALRGSDKYYNF
jgi:hypothetical protein